MTDRTKGLILVALYVVAAGLLWAANTVPMGL